MMNLYKEITDKALENEKGDALMTGIAEDAAGQAIQPVPPGFSATRQ